MDLNYLLVAAGVLIALLSLWAQLWVNFGKKDRITQHTASIGLLWIYLSIVIAMASIGVVLIGEYWEGLTTWNISVFNKDLKTFLFDLGFGFLVTSFLMGIANMTESAVSIVYKGQHGKTAFDSIPDKAPSPSKYRKTLRTLLLIALTLLIISVFGSIWNHWVYLGYIPLIVVSLLTQAFE